MKDGEAFCGACGNRILPPAHPGNPIHENSSSGSFSFIETINEYIGNTGNVNLNWKDLFVDVFKKHTDKEAENIFICGTEDTTPPLFEVSATWPKPWLYSRVFLMFLTAFILLYFCASFFQNSNVIPGLIVVGAFTVPLTTMVLFLEVNAYRNISFYRIIKIFLVGGCASLVVTLFLFGIFGGGELDFVGACAVGVIEETGKMIIVYVFLKHLKCKYILNGLLVGAAVGAGFAAFESSGYAFNNLLQVGWGGMMDNIFLRALLAPGGHVTWAAISGGALIFAKGAGDLDFSVIMSGKFLRIFSLPIILHSVWDMPIDIGSEYNLIQILLTLAVWIIVLIFINMGLDEVRKIKSV